MKVTLTLLLAVWTPIPSVAADGDVDYARDVKPILRAHCYRCHGVRKQESRLRLDTGLLARRGGENGAVLKPGDSAGSRLIERVTAEDREERMPPEGAALSAKEIGVLSRWIDAGAAVPGDEKPEENPLDHWAFRPPVRPDVPQPAQADWVRNPIDAFLAARHEQLELVRQDEAPPTVLLRRAHFDLVGLPPTPGEVAVFQADTAAGRWGRLVDRLLESPRYGERWGRHWMDVWRYSDWYGYQKQLRNSHRHIWRWRDWIVESLNEDASYARMVQQMLAADEMADATPASMRASGFLARNYYLFNRNTWLDATVEHTGKAFLGLTINCARCHDHMYDPVAQRDYYAFRAIFEPHQVRTDPLAGEFDPAKEGLAVAYDAKPDTPTFLFERGNDKRPDKEHPLSPTIPAFFAGELSLKIETIKLPPQVYYPGLREPVRRAVEEKARKSLDKQKARVESFRKALAAAGQPSDKPDAGSTVARTKVDLELSLQDLAVAEAELTGLRARLAADSARYLATDAEAARAAAVTAATATRKAKLLQAEAGLARAKAEQAAARNSGDKKKTTAANKKHAAATKSLAVAKKEAAKTDGKYPPLTKVYPSTSTGRRLALARWITDPRNPLTARVCVNHIWARHFGRPLVASVFDLGNNGRPPTHPALLDWLAVELVENGWSMKHLHRLIMTSAAYRLHSSQSGGDPATRKRDRDNRMLWRMNSRRLESELVRDSVLFACGGLDARMGGPELDPGLGLSTGRRSLYYRHAPEKMMVFLDVFDAASTNECYQRNETVVPQQALALVNSRLAIEHSRRLAAELSARVGLENTVPHKERFLEQAFLRMLSRPPTAPERAACLEFLAEQARRLANPGQLTRLGSGSKLDVKPSPLPHLRARENLVHVLINHNEFLTIR